MEGVTRGRERACSKPSATRCTLKRAAAAWYSAMSRFHCSAPTTLYLKRSMCCSSMSFRPSPTCTPARSALSTRRARRCQHKKKRK